MGLRGRLAVDVERANGASTRQSAEAQTRSEGRASFVAARGVRRLGSDARGAGLCCDRARRGPTSRGPARGFGPFDDESLSGWWGGTIISISGVAEEMREVVFDDGERQGSTPRMFSLAAGRAAARLQPQREGRTAGKMLPKPGARKRPAPKRPPRRRPPPRPQMPTGNCPVCYEPFQSGEVKSFNCGHHLCSTCGEALARHKAEQGVNTTRQGVQVSCPLCRKRARVLA